MDVSSTVDRDRRFNPWGLLAGLALLLGCQHEPLEPGLDDEDYPAGDVP